MISYLSIPLVAFALFFTASDVFGDEPASAWMRPVRVAAVQPQDIKATLPEIQVRPPQEVAPKPEPDESEPDQPEATETESDTPPSMAPSEPLDRVPTEIAPVEMTPIETLPMSPNELGTPAVPLAHPIFRPPTFRNPRLQDGFPATREPTPANLAGGMETNSREMNTPGANTSTARPEPVAPSMLDRLFDGEFGQAGALGESTGIFRTGSSLFDSPASVSIRSRNAIEQRQAPDMFHALQNEVGVLMQSTSAGQASPFIRGLTGQQVLILIDGIRLNNSITRRGPNQYFNTIDPGMIDHIEVLRGQGSVLWGSDAIGGAINVVTRGADMQRGLHESGYVAREFTQYYNTANSSPSSRFNVEGWVGARGLFGGASFLDVNDLDTGFDEFSRQPGTNYQQLAGDLKFNFMLSDRSMLTFAMQHFEQSDLPRSDRFPGYPLDRNHSNTLGKARFFDPQQRDLMYLRHQALDPFGGLFDAITTTVSYHRQREVQTRGVPTTRFQETNVGTLGLQSVVSKDMGDLGKWTSGLGRVS